MEWSLIWMVMKWPLVACLVLPPILVYYGLHIVRRGIIFVDLALAQMAAVGTCVSLMLGHDTHDPQTYLYSLGFTLLGACIFTITRPRDGTRVPQEAIIGIVYVVAAATCLLLLSRTTEGNEELKRTLIGDVLTVQPMQIGKTFLLFAGIGVVHYLCRRKFLALSFQPETLTMRPAATLAWDFLFYALFGLVVTSFVQIGGVLLVFSYLIVPAVCANLLAQRLGGLLLTGWLIAALSSGLGLVASYQFDWPTGAAIVCMLGLVLILVALARLSWRKLKPHIAPASS